jgi:hypothetical protein
MNGLPPGGRQLVGLHLPGADQTVERSWVLKEATILTWRNSLDAAFKLFPKIFVGEGCFPRPDLKNLCDCALFFFSLI